MIILIQKTSLYMIIDGKIVSKKIMEDIKERLKNGPKIMVAAIAYKEDKESIVYFNSIKRNAEKAGIGFNLLEIEGKDLIEKINELNDDSSVTGIIVGRPFPPGITNEIVSLALNPDKDIDCVTPHNLGLLNFNINSIAPATPKATIDILEQNGISLKGKNVLVINRSVTVGRPLVNLLLNRDATVTIAHSKTSNMEKMIEDNDIIILAVGKAGYLKSSSIKGKKIIVDVGINVVGDRIVGDFENDAQREDIDYTPVPGGVGSVTSAEILKNALDIVNL
ncbi:MAG: bifunctional 5,10-methylenetetrahydrofolate dehydrogenase/5,10-methenyltetrahydrofolate cyclohydrolase [Thermoplasmata archaeon]